jgi:opacity protein-like surface antigen
MSVPITAISQDTATITKDKPKPELAPENTDYSWTIEGMYGISYNLRTFNFKAKRLNYTPSVRILWKPEHRLNLGVEATYLMIAKTDEKLNDDNYGSGRFEAILEALPIYAVFNMRLFYLDWTAGIGAAYMRSTVTSFGDEAISNNWHYCFNLGIGFSFDIWKNFGMGLEGKVFSFTKTNQYVATAHLKLIYHFLY